MTFDLSERSMAAVYASDGGVDVTPLLVATRPDAAALKAFMDKGTTHFAASGLPA